MDGDGEKDKREKTKAEKGDKSLDKPTNIESTNDDPLPSNSGDDSANVNSDNVISNEGEVTSAQDDDENMPFNEAGDDSTKKSTDGIQNNVNDNSASVDVENVTSNERGGFSTKDSKDGKQNSVGEESAKDDDENITSKEGGDNSTRDSKDGTQDSVGEDSAKDDDENVISNGGDENSATVDVENVTSYERGDNSTKDSRDSNGGKQEVDGDDSSKVNAENIKSNEGGEKTAQDDDENFKSNEGDEESANIDGENIKSRQGGDNSTKNYKDGTQRSVGGNSKKDSKDGTQSSVEETSKENGSIGKTSNKGQVEPEESKEETVNQIRELQIERTKLRNERLHFEKLTDKLSKENETNQKNIANIIRIHAEFGAEMAEKDILNEEQIKDLENDLLKQTKSKEELAKRLAFTEETGKKANQQNMKVIENLKKKVSELKNRNDDLTKKYDEAKRQSKSLQREKDHQKAEHKKSNNYLYDRIKNFTDEIKEHKRTENSLRRTIEEGKFNFERLANQYHDKVNQVQRLYEEKMSLNDEKQELLLRLSKLAGANLTYNNPNIADLSDEKRPTKLAEDFSELYDNEWTDAFEALQFKDEDEKTTFMLNILKKTSQLCNDLSNGHSKRIKDSICTLTATFQTNASIGGKDSADELNHQNLTVNAESSPMEEDVVENAIEATEEEDYKSGEKEDQAKDKIIQKNKNSDTGKDAKVDHSAINDNGGIADTRETVLKGSPPKKSGAGDRANFTDSTEERREDGEPDNTLESDAGNNVNVAESSEESRTEGEPDNTQDPEEKSANNTANDALAESMESDATDIDNVGESSKEDGKDEETDITQTPENKHDAVFSGEGRVETTNLQNTRNQVETDRSNKGNDVSKDWKSHEPEAQHGNTEITKKENSVTVADTQTTQKVDNGDLKTDEYTPRKDMKNTQVSEGSFNTNATEELQGQLTEDGTSREAENTKSEETIQEICIVSDFNLLQNEQKKSIMDAKNFFETTLTKEVETTVTDLMCKAFKIDKERQDVLVTYITKCVNICWSMCRHNPPVHMEFTEVMENVLFDTNKFKPYMKSGKYIDFIVWPPLFLHEGGPLLCKGVAQGGIKDMQK